MKVIFVVVDSLRADALGCYGGQVATPTLDQLAASGARFESVISAAPWTVPSIASLLTGVWSHRLGLMKWEQPWPAEVPTLFDATRHCGLETASFVFDPDHLFRACPEAGVVGSSQDTEAMLAWFRARRGGDYFAFVHHWWTHVPYLQRKLPLSTWNQLCREILARLSVPDPVARRANREQIKGLYARAVREFSERWLPALLDAAQADVVVLVSDHGESWGERLSIEESLTDVFDLHGNHLHNEVLRIPWILYAPQLVRPVTVSGLARSVDVTPTLVELLNLDPGEHFFKNPRGSKNTSNPAPRALAGHSLVPALTSGSIPDGDLAFSARNHDFVDAETVPTDPGEVYAELGCQDRSAKLMLNFPSGETHAYDLRHDPEEQEPLPAQDPSLRKLDQALHRERAAAAVAPFAPEEFALMKRQLQRLGYL